jgi:hypothetical protein
MYVMIDTNISIGLTVIYWQVNETVVFAIKGKTSSTSSYPQIVN